MRQVTIECVTTPTDYHDLESTRVVVDGKVIAEGYYRGEPEDNCRGRTYAWVEHALAKLAAELGAEVTCVDVTEDEDV